MLRMTNWIVAIVIACLSCSYAKACLAEQRLSISARCSAIINQYRTASSSLNRSGRSTDGLRHMLTEVRNEAFRDLLASAPSIGLISSEDLAALAVASEYLRKTDDCIGYASAATEIDCSTLNAYGPLIRSLLNRNRVDEAEAALKLGEVSCPEFDGWGMMHHLFYHRYRANRNHDRGIEHFSAYLSSAIRREVEVPGSADIGAAAIQEFGWYVRKYDNASTLAAAVNELEADVNAELVQLLSQTFRSGAHPARVASLLSLFRVRCELARARNDTSALRSRVAQLRSLAAVADFIYRNEFTKQLRQRVAQYAAVSTSGESPSGRNSQEPAPVGR